MLRCRDACALTAFLLYVAVTAPRLLSPPVRATVTVQPSSVDAERRVHNAERTVHAAAQWMLPGESTKHGVGLLFFAYGGTKQVSHFLNEASAAALSIRELNPGVNIAVVTNNETVDRFIFTHHVTPRADLLFPGSDCPDTCRPDRLPRQWTTRLYYMALSPFETTWAMDSNVYACPSPHAAGAIHRFLLAAERTRLWGYDIAHANQADDEEPMFPHCFNMVWRWTPQTSNVFRDWFMLMLRRGISTNDQEPLRQAESRQQQAGGLRVGQVPSEFGAAMYPAIEKRDGGGRARISWPRISRRLAGPAQLVHATPLAAGSKYVSRRAAKAYTGLNGPAFCHAYNAPGLVGRPRQLVQWRHRGAFTVVLNDSACTELLSVRECPYTQGGLSDPTSQGALLPTRLMDADVLKKLISY